jgi:hypothetical protein
MKTDDDDAAQPTDDPRSREMTEEEIDETLAATFPASDPPSWTLGSNHHSETNPEPESVDPADD